MVNCGSCRSRKPGEARLWRVKPVTLREYRRSLSRFLDWLEDHSISPLGAVEWDEAACNFCALEQLSYGEMGTLVAAVELCFPRFRKLLAITRADAEGLLRNSPVERKQPLCRGPASLFAARAAAQHVPRLGAALITQHAAGLRPMESH